jgi:hypothetical protein
MSSNSNVAITISVIDQGGTKSVIELQGALEGLGQTSNKVGNQMQRAFGPPPIRPSSWIRETEEASQHMLTSLDNVRLLRDDLGIRIPRSMEKAIASSAVLSGAIGAIGSTLLGVGAVEIFAHMGEEIYNAYEKYLDLSGAAEEYQKQIEKTKGEDFINTHSIETANARIIEATKSAQQLQALAQQMHGGLFSDVGNGASSGGLMGGLQAAIMDTFGARKMADAGNVKQEQADALKPKQVADQHELNLGAIELQHASDARLKGEAAITAEMQKQLQINAENQRFGVQQDKLHGNVTPGNAGNAMQDQKDAIVLAETSAKRIEQAQKEHDEILHLQKEAIDASLTGNALYAAQEQQSIDEVVRKFQQGEISKQAEVAETAAIRAKSDGDAIKRQDELDARVRKATADAAAAGLTGIARIQAEMSAAIQAIDDEEKKAIGRGGVETPQQSASYQALRGAAASAGNEKQIEAERQFYEELTQLGESYDTSSLEGYAKIDSEAQERINNITKHWQESYGQMDAMDLSSVLAFTQSMGKIVEVEADANQQRERLHRQTMESLTKEEELAARDSLPPWMAAEMAIADTYNDRVRKAKEALDHQQIDQTEYNATMVAASAVAQAQMTKQMQQTRDQLASQLQSFFQHPEQFIEKKAMDTAFQFAANEMMQLFQKDGSNPVVGGLGWLFGMNGQASTSTDPKTFGKSLLGMGGHGAGGTGMSSISQAGTTFTTASTTMTTASSTFLTAVQMFQQSVSTSGFGGGMGTGGGGTGLGSFANLGGGSAGDGGSTSSSSDFSLGYGGADMGSYSGMATSNALSGGGTGVTGTGEMAGIGSSATGTAAAASNPYLGAAGGAITGALGVYSAYQNSNPLGGALSGAMLGASVGSIIPGVGTAIGAVVGGIAGLLAGVFGDQGKSQAQDYDSKTIQPGIAAELQQYNSGSTGYEQATQYLSQLQVSAQQQTSTWGRGASSWYRSHILSEIQAAQQQIATEEKNGRSLVGMSAAQYHTGGWIGDFGDYGTSSTEGFIHAKAGEFMVHDGAAAGNGALLQAINSGRSVSPAAAQGSRMVPASMGGGFTIPITAWDGASVDSWLRNGGALRMSQAVNAATGQYGGIGRR